MPLLIKPVFDASTLEASFNQSMKGLADKADLPIKTKFDKEGLSGLDTSLTRATSAAKKFNEELEDIGDTAKKSQGTLSKMFEMDKLNMAKDAFGDLKDIFDATAVSLFGFSEETANATVKSLDLAEKGFAVGAAFGPWGAIIGAGAGGALGYFSSQAEEATKKQEELTKKTEEAAKEFEKLKAENEDLRESFSKSSTRDVPAIIDNMRELDKKLIETSKNLKAESSSYEAWMERFGLIAQKQADDAGIAAGLIQGKVMDGLAAANDALFGGKKQSKSAMTEELKDLQDPSNSMGIPALQKKLGALSTEMTTFKEQHGMKASGSFIEGWEKDAEELNAQLQIAIGRKDELERELKPKGGGGSSSKKEKVAALPTGLSSGEESLMDIEGMREAREEVNNLTESMWLLEAATLAGDPGDSAIGQLGRDAVYAAEAAEKLGLVWDELQKKFVTAPTPKPNPNAPKKPSEYDEQTNALMKLLDLDEKMKGTAESIRGLGQMFGSEIGGVAADSVDLLFERIATGEKAAKGSFGRVIASFLRDTGTQLIADGVKNQLIGLGENFLLPGSGTPKITLGTIEVGTGLAMGGLGAGFQRGLGSAPEQSESDRGSRGAGGSVGPSRSGGDSGPRVQSPIVINMSGVPFGIMTEREQTEIGQRISQSLTTYNANGGPSFPV